MNINVLRLVLYLILILFCAYGIVKAEESRNAFRCGYYSTIAIIITILFVGI